MHSIQSIEHYITNDDLKLHRGTSPVTKAILLWNLDWSISTQSPMKGDKRMQTRSNILKTFSEMAYSTLSAEDLMRMESAMMDAVALHMSQKWRPDGPYPQHVTWVAHKVFCTLWITDPDMFIAACLHDAVEDQPEKLALYSSEYDERWYQSLKNDHSIESEKYLQKHALLWVKQKYWEEVMNIVAGLTNPIQEKWLSSDDKRKHYFEHVKSATESDERVFWIKLMDFNENGLNLVTINNKDMRLHLSTKYLPVFEHFVTGLKKKKKERKLSMVTNEIISDQIYLLEEAHKHAHEFIACYEQ